jgi:hypothetical protein
MESSGRFHCVQIFLEFWAHNILFMSNQSYIPAIHCATHAALIELPVCWLAEARKGGELDCDAGGYQGINSIR